MNTVNTATRHHYCAAEKGVNNWVLLKEHAYACSNSKSLYMWAYFKVYLDNLPLFVLQAKQCAAQEEVQ